MDARGGRAGHADAGGSRAVDALGISYRANVIVAFVSDAVFYGSGHPLSVFEYSGAVESKEKDLTRGHGESTEFPKKREAGQVFPPPFGFPVSGKYRLA
jgi:hypothetical protein